MAFKGILLHIPSSHPINVRVRNVWTRGKPQMLISLVVHVSRAINHWQVIKNGIRNLRTTTASHYELWIFEVLVASPGDWASNRNRPRACEVTGFNTWYFSSTELHFLPVLGRRQEPQVGEAPLPITGEGGSVLHSPESQDYWRERLLTHPPGASSP